MVRDKITRRNVWALVAPKRIEYRSQPTTMKQAAKKGKALGFIVLQENCVHHIIYGTNHVMVFFISPEYVFINRASRIRQMMPEMNQ